MVNWKQYSWSDFGRSDLPWTAHSEQPVMPAAKAPGGNLFRAGTTSEYPTSMNFEPDRTFYTVLIETWAGHPPGSRVVLDASQIAIELPNPTPANLAGPATASKL